MRLHDDYGGIRRHRRGQHRAQHQFPTRLLLATAALLAFAAGVVIFHPTTQPVAHWASPTPTASITPTAASPSPSPRPTVQAASRATTRPPAPKPSPKPPAWVKPVTDYTFTSPFGMRGGAMHNGVDLANDTGTPIHAASAGTITLATTYDYGGYGYAVIIDHGGGIATLYGHNSAVLVTPGQHVAAGQVIALMGATGDATGPHCHFETHINDQPVDPVPFMAARGITL